MIVDLNRPRGHPFIFSIFFLADFSVPSKPIRSPAFADMISTAPLSA
ncbi:hypothetical protein [Sphingomonas sp. CFBP 13733]|nr:hypothetical protein [Sphingomonas sp. CFBP 13733]